MTDDDRQLLTGTSSASLEHFRDMAERATTRAEAHRARAAAATADDVGTDYLALAAAADAEAAQWTALADELVTFATETAVGDGQETLL